MSEETKEAVEQEAPVTKDLPIKTAIEQTTQIQKDINAMVKDLQDRGLTNSFYPEDSVVEIPGQVFASISNLLISIANNSMMNQANLMQLAEMQASAMVAAAQHNKELMKAHVKAVEAGITIPTPKEEPAIPPVKKKGHQKAPSIKPKAKKEKAK